MSRLLIQNDKSPIRPFGENSFEEEIELLGDKWSEYFVENERFINRALLKKTYLIVGRKGSGKSTLAKYIAQYQESIGANSIIVSENDKYSIELFELCHKLNYSTSLANEQLVEVWNQIFWQLIFEKYKDENPKIKKALLYDDDSKSSFNYFKIIVKGVISKFVSDSSDELIRVIIDDTTEKLNFKAQKEVLKILKNKPLYILIDSRERYRIDEKYDMWITAALVQCASEFNLKFSRKGLHLKVCVSDEIFPYLKEGYVENVVKHVKDPLFMYWNPLDILRLTCYKFYKYLYVNELIYYTEGQINWEDNKDIREKLWYPYFGKTLINRRGFEEKVFSYILRHTHLRPRQFILVCNKIAEIAQEKNEFPKFSPETIKQGILNTEIHLSDELINSYTGIHEKPGAIMAALASMPIEFQAKELEKLGNRTRGAWHDRKYSPEKFRDILVQMGVIGRKRGNKKSNPQIIEADFEFALDDRLLINDGDTCVIHPMFYSKLNINRQNPSDCCVYPFPNYEPFNFLDEI